MREEFEQNVAAAIMEISDIIQKYQALAKDSQERAAYFVVPITNVAALNCHNYREPLEMVKEFKRYFDAAFEHQEEYKLSQSRMNDDVKESEEAELSGISNVQRLNCN